MTHFLSTMQIFLRNISALFATGCYLGRLPWAPGTWGSTGGLLLGYILLRYSHFLGYLGAILCLFLIGWWAIYHYSKNYKKSIDDPSIVIDEILGMLISMAPMSMTMVTLQLADGSTYALNLLAVLPLPQSLIWLFVLFALFRLFDIWKPWPIGWVDRRMPSAFGTLLDDILAGVLTALAYYGIIYLLAWTA